MDRRKRAGNMAKTIKFNDLVWDKVKDYLIGCETRRYWASLHWGKTKVHPLIITHNSSVSLVSAVYFYTLEHVLIAPWTKRHLYSFSGEFDVRRYNLKQGAFVYKVYCQRDKNNVLYYGKAVHKANITL